MDHKVSKMTTNRHNMDREAKMTRETKRGYKETKITTEK